MKISQCAACLAIALTGLAITSNASATPGFSEPAPNSSIRLCIARIADRANYNNAGRVLHEVDSKERRVSGHKMIIETTVFAAEDGQAIREYATVCSVSDDQETKSFKIREKGR